MDLKYKTRGNSTARGKAKVYFACHPEDFDEYFESISDEILKKQNCTIYYYEPGTVVDDNTLLMTLDEMQLVVIPITTKFLYQDSVALNTVFGYAETKHIPVLPIMMEAGIDRIFNAKCGDLQYLDMFSNDNTAISFDKKLEKYLSAVLLDEELEKKIRESFDAYIFLSYRKIDRIYAKELMKLIHRNPFCRDIAIWYDEFLNPGENFNEAIKEALLKSDLFVLTVTPNVVREDNYIITTEYPMAVQEGKPVIPVELASTDQQQLNSKYRNLPRCIEAYNDKELSKALFDVIKRVAVKEVKGSPEHTYFIGLAYLAGVDVEVDYEKALALITSAALENLPEAANKLFDMYLNGIGVERNIEKAQYWKEKETEICYRKFEQNRQSDAYVQWFESAESLCDFYIRFFGNNRKTLEHYRRLEDNLYDFSLAEDKLKEHSMRGRLYTYMGIYYSEIGELALAEEYMLKAKGIIEGIYTRQKEVFSRLVTDDVADSVQSMLLYYAEDRTRLSILYESLYLLHCKKGREQTGISFLLKVYEIRKELCDLVNNHPVFETNLIITLLNLSSFYVEHKEYEEAEKYIVLGEERTAEYLKQTGSLYIGEYQMRLVSLHAEVHRNKGNVKKAEECYRFCIDSISGSKQTPALVALLISIQLKLAELLILNGQINEALLLFEQAQKVYADSPKTRELDGRFADTREKINVNPVYIKNMDAHYRLLIEKNQQSMSCGYSEDKMFEFAVLMFKLARVYYDGKRYEPAKENYLRALKACKFMMKSDMWEQVVPYMYLIHSELAECFLNLDNPKKAEKLKKKLIKIARKNLNKKLDADAYCFIIKAHQDVGDFFKTAGKMTAAKKYYMFAVGYAEILLNVFGGEKNTAFVAEFYFRAGVLDKNNVDKQLLTSAHNIWSKLSAEYPGKEIYENGVNMVKDLI